MREEVGAAAAGEVDDFDPKERRSLKPNIVSLLPNGEPPKSKSRLRRGASEEDEGVAVVEAEEEENPPKSGFDGEFACVDPLASDEEERFCPVLANESNEGRAGEAVLLVVPLADVKDDNPLGCVLLANESYDVLPFVWLEKLPMLVDPVLSVGRWAPATPPKRGGALIVDPAPPSSQPCASGVFGRGLSRTLVTLGRGRDKTDVGWFSSFFPCCS